MEAESPSDSAQRQKRKSAPPPARQMERRLSESWEYPLSKEEKKDRVIFLFEQELSEVRQSEEEQAFDELYNQLERIEELRPGTAKRLKEAVRSIGLFEEAREGTGSHPRPPRLFLGILASFLVVLLAFLVFWVWRQSGAVLEPVEPGARSSNSSVLSPVGEDLPESAVRGTTEDAAEKPGVATTAAATTSTTSTTTAAASFTIDMSQVKRLHLVGRDNLKRSDCYGAAHYFNLSRALFLKLEPQANLTAPSGLHFTLVADHGFALICARRFEEAMTLLLGCLNGTLQCSSYLMNAIGYAFWQLQDVARAAQVFHMCLATDPENPIIWNNLGAAQMDLGDLEGADEALDKALALFKAGLSKDPEHEKVTVANVNELQIRAQGGQATRRPEVDIWYGGGDEATSENGLSEL